MTLTVSRASSDSAKRRMPPTKSFSLIRWLKSRFFSDVFSGIGTLFVIWGVFFTIPKLFLWGVSESVWIFGTAEECHTAAGACWAVIGEKYRVMLFGTFPYEEHWRGLAVIIIIVSVTVVSFVWKTAPLRLVSIWILGILSVLVLMLGGIFGLKVIETHEWSGLPLTLLMFYFTLAFGTPIGYLLALGRKSNMPVIRGICVGFIEVTRGLPLVTVLFMASLMIPLLLPGGVTIDKFLRATIAMTLFYSAYVAEIVRGGLQAIDRGQYEAADALALQYWQKMFFVVLPQVSRIIIPSLMNEVIRAFKNTTFVGIIGLFDILKATSSALQDPVWVQFSIEAYLFIVFLYFVFCFSMSQYSLYVEKRLTIKK